MTAMPIEQSSPQAIGLREDTMLTPEDVSAMARLHELGWGTRRIAVELGCSRNTVKRYLEADGWVGFRRPRRKRRLDGLEAWLADRFHRHRGNCDVVRQDLARARHHGVVAPDRARHGAAAPGFAGRGAGLCAVRDATWAATVVACRSPPEPARPERTGTR